MRSSKIEPFCAFRHGRATNVAPGFASKAPVAFFVSMDKVPDKLDMPDNIVAVAFRQILMNFDFAVVAVEDSARCFFLGKL